MIKIINTNNIKLERNKKIELVLMFMSCYMEPISLNKLFMNIDAWRMNSFNLDLSKKDVEIALISKFIISKNGKYIIKDINIREKYFMQFFNEKKELFDQFTQFILAENEYSYDSTSRVISAYRVGFYLNKYKVGLYYDKRFYDYLLSLTQTGKLIK